MFRKIMPVATAAAVVCKLMEEEDLLCENDEL